ncbi:phosphonate ABC transporter, permease protein PhnE [Arenibaculum pallidiluteum]|uniref:phosphonate ABC transporter, permease protein PhnE n=1 Tax=Arenibaculum pallidiluteum TaxID=2812559 RepID=UPI001A95EA83|nr:phosphonate ABC transporter, permease protein PhnE [Arenibaculum pallidiluteum]
MSTVAPAAPTVPRHPAPPRFERPGPGAFAAAVAALAVLAAAIDGVGLSLTHLVEGIPSIGRILERMWPLDLSRLPFIGQALLETFQMALVGTVLGVALSVPLAIAATRSHSPHPLVYLAARGLISVFRTVPDLVWALLFVVAVGLGPFAGTLAIMVDAVGFCGRFFAEAMEEADKGPQEALRALGAGRLGIVFCAVVPASLPSFVNTALFNLEKATRSSVVLGLVGAGGIGIELKVAMDLFSYDLAATIILAVFLLVVLVEQGSALIRRRLM